VIILDNGCIIGDGRPEDLSPELLYGSIKDDYNVDNNKGNDNDSNDKYGNDINDNDSDHSSNDDDKVRFNTIYNKINDDDDDVDCIPITSSYKYRGTNGTNNNRDIINENKNDNNDNSNEDNDNDADKVHSELYHPLKNVSNKNKNVSTKKSKNDEDEINDKILKEKIKLLILKETMKKGDVNINVYLKYFAACYQQPGYSIFNENPDPDTGVDTDENKKTQNKCMFNLKSSLLILGLLLVFSIAQVLNVGINYCLARWAEYGGLADGSLLNNNYSKAYYIFFGVLFIFLFIRSAYLNVVSSYSAQHIYR
jgi:hypothetical protein